MKLKSTGKKILSTLLAAAMTFSIAASSAVSAAPAADTDFASELESSYVDPDRVYSTEVRWWISEAANTDEVLLEEIQAMYDGGFRGVELCMQTDDNADDQTYAYGSDMWSHKWKLMMNKLLDLGMTVSLTSGTNWATSNVPGLDPDSQQAMQCINVGSKTVKAGETLSVLPTPSKHREKGQFVGVYAHKIVNETVQSVTSWGQTTYFTAYDVADGTEIDLTDLVTEGENVWTQNLNWTAPDDGDYAVFALWMEGTAHASSPAAETSYATNYFDERGVATLKEYWEEHYLNEPELNEKIKNGDVQLFMDSMEINTGNGIGWWSEDFAEEFEARKGYDIRPYIFLIKGACDSYWSNPYQPTKGANGIAGDDDRTVGIINDYLDVITDLYMERMLTPLKEWLNSVGIKTRAQISYGKPFEISEPIMAVDYPEAENRVMYNQIDYFRIWTGGAKLQNKILSSEVSAQTFSAYALSNQMHLMDAYSHYAAGFSRVIWHIWSAGLSYGENGQWPGWETTFPGFGSVFYCFGTREPSSRDYDEFNAHIGRIQQLMQTGESRTDIGFIRNSWVQGLVDSGEGPAVSMNWMKAHQGVFYRSTELQDNGYSYDYFSPEFLFADGVYFDEETQTIEQAGYKAIVLWQDWLDIKGAEKILEWAKKGLKVVIMENAAQRTPFNDGKDAELAEVIAELKALDTVRTAEIYDAPEDFNYADPTYAGYDDGVLEALQELGVRPYAEYIEPNHQLLTQTRQDEDGNMYLYAYNYCSNDYHQNSSIESVRSEDHGTNIQTEIKMDGMFVPYMIDAWTGEVTEIANYYYENGQTVFPIDLDYGNIALFAFEAVEEEPFHALNTTADAAYATENGFAIRATESDTYVTELNNGEILMNRIDVPAAYDITNWDVTVESWTEGENMLYKEETIGDVHTINSKPETAVTEINVKLDKLTTWDNIPEVGKNVSGLGHYKAAFNWDASKADGAYIDFGVLNESMKVWINGQKVGGDITRNATKLPQSILEGVSGAEEYTGGVNWVKPIVDVSEYLVDGENEIEIEYSSNLTNVQLTRGKIKPTQAIYNWFGYVLDYRSYGPAQAVVIPFVDEEILPPETDPVKSVSAPESAQVGTDFVVEVVTASSITDVKLFNEYDMAMAAKDVSVTENEDGTRTFAITLSVGTVGNGRTFKVVTKGSEGYYKDSGKTASLDITSIPPVLNSFELPETGVANRAFIVKATTDMAATKIVVYNEYGARMGLRSLSYKVMDGQKVWTGVMAIGTKGDRTFTAYAVNKYGAQSESVTDNISVKAFA